MNTETIVFREIENDGSTVHVYYEPEVGLYVAFGFSAYYVTMATNAILSFSDMLSMPVALFRKKQLTEVRGSMKLLSKREGEYYCFKTQVSIGDAGYETWARSIKR